MTADAYWTTYLARDNCRKLGGFCELVQKEVSRRLAFLHDVGDGLRPRQMSTYCRNRSSATFTNVRSERESLCVRFLREVVWIGRNFAGSLSEEGPITIV
jgi:hypothetical protein